VLTMLLVNCDLADILPVLKAKQGLWEINKWIEWNGLLIVVA